MSYSQINQDKQVIKFYNSKNNGYFLDIGAYDGKYLSNTYLLETSYNWSGICVEPILSSYNICKNNRPKSICINKAAFSKSGELLEFSEMDSGVYSGITDYIDCHKGGIPNAKKYSVETISVDDLLKENNAPKFIEYMSIDTEGSELEILKSINFNEYTFGLIHLEHNYVEPRRTEMRKLLESNGYKYLGENQWDDNYAHVSMIKK